MTRPLVAVSMLGLLLMTAPAVFAETCLDRLEGNTYTCLYKSSFNSTATSSTLSFFAAAFVYDASWSGFTLVPAVKCACGTDGSFKTPQFEHSKTKWSCLGAASDGIETKGLAIEGSVGAAGKITKVVARSFINDFGLVIDNSTYTLSCEKND
jgi:hypothetical protein